MIPLKGRIILKEIQEKKLFKGIIIPQQLAANQITFAKVIALPKEPLDTHNLKIGDYVVLGYSPIWEKKFKHKGGNKIMSIKTEDIIEVKEGWHNFILKEPLKRSRRQTNTIYN